MGAGIGLVDAQWHIYGSSQRDDPFFESLPFDVSLEKSLFSGVIFADYHLKLNEFSFFSLYFDHTFTSAQDFPEIPEIYLTKYKRSYGNTSFGVSLGLSF